MVSAKCLMRCLWELLGAFSLVDMVSKLCANRIVYVNKKWEYCFLNRLFDHPYCSLCRSNYRLVVCGYYSVWVACKHSMPKLLRQAIKIWLSVCPYVKWFQMLIIDQYYVVCKKKSRTLWIEIYPGQTYQRRWAFFNFSSEAGWWVW